MYESYTRQALPSKNYRELLGSALCVFNSNNAFIIENILRSDSNNQYDWYHLMDLESGRLTSSIINTITRQSDESIANLFCEIVVMRNRIIHSFQISRDDEMVLATKTKVKDGNYQFVITEMFLLEFLEKNEKLCDELHKFRGF